MVDPTGTRQATGGERKNLDRVFGAQMAIVPVYNFPISRSVSFPYEIDFASKVYSQDFSKTRDSAQMATYWHEQYHVFEMSIGHKSWTSMASEQLKAGFKPKIYRWDDSKDFNSQTFEARAAAFGGCMSGSGCSRLEGMSISGRGTNLSFKNGEFTLTQERTGSRIPERTTFKPEDLELKK
ncbi:hypothetical protein [Novosphingopyxis sp.]|uniref:hypothetical protein n=1 Tax=Novosphingopyxis sp. TaxID=2709690 RepID=UPI003B5AD369